MAIQANFFDRITNIRNAYKKAYNEAKQARQEAVDDLKANYRRNSPRWDELRKAIPENFNNAIEKAKSQAMNDLADATEQEKIRIEAQVKAGFKSNSVKELQGVLSMLDNAVVTAPELTALIDCYGNRSYWSDRLLESFCTKNGMIDIPLEPDLATRLQIINEMNGLVERLLEYYDGNDTDETKTFASTHINVIDAAEYRYTNNFVGLSSVPQEKLVRRALHAIYGQPDTMAQVQALANVLRTSSGETRDAIIDRLVADARLPEQVINFTHFDRVVAEHEALKAARAKEEANPYYATTKQTETLSPKELAAARFYSALKGSHKLTADSLKQTKTELPELRVADVTRYESGYLNTHNSGTIETQRVRDTAEELRTILQSEGFSHE